MVIDLETLEETTMRSVNGLEAASCLTQSREKSQPPDEAVPEDRQRQPVHAQQTPISSTVASGANSAESQVHDDSLGPLAKTKSKSSSRSEGKKQKRKQSGRTSEPLGEEDVQKTKKRKVDRSKGKESSVSDPFAFRYYALADWDSNQVNPTSANGEPSRLASPSMPQATVDLFLCSVCNTTIETLDDLKHHLLTSCTYASGSQMAEAQGFSCHTCEKRFSHPQEFEAHLLKKKRHMRVRSRKSKYNDLNLKTQAKRDIEHLPTPPRRPASSPPRHNRPGESQTPARPAPRSEPISPSLEEVIGVEDCTMYCRQCDEDFLTVEALVDHFIDTHGDDTSYCYTCAETFTKPHLLWPHLYTSPRHECAPPGTKFEFSSTAYRWEALMKGQRCSGEAPIDISAANETRKVSHPLRLEIVRKLTLVMFGSAATDEPSQDVSREAYDSGTDHRRRYRIKSILVKRGIAYTEARDHTKHAMSGIDASSGLITIQSLFLTVYAIQGYTISNRSECLCSIRQDALRVMEGSVLVVRWSPHGRRYLERVGQRLLRTIADRHTHSSSKSSKEYPCPPAYERATGRRINP
jgi:hypothetical protein